MRIEYRDFDDWFLHQGLVVRTQQPKKLAKRAWDCQQVENKNLEQKLKDQQQASFWGRVAARQVTKIIKLKDLLKDLSADFDTRDDSYVGINNHFHTRIKEALEN